MDVLVDDDELEDEVDIVSDPAPLSPIPAPQPAPVTPEPEPTS